MASVWTSERVQSASRRVRCERAGWPAFAFQPLQEKGGIIIPDTAKEKPQEGNVAAVALTDMVILKELISRH
jgi:hypothetical protein